MDRIKSGLSNFVSEISRSSRDSSQQRTVQIVDFKSSSRPVLNTEAVQNIITEDLPTVVVTIGGVARSGKSFLLNLFVSILTYIEEVQSDTILVLCICFICTEISV